MGRLGRYLPMDGKGDTESGLGEIFFGRGGQASVLPEVLVPMCKACFAPLRKGLQFVCASGESDRISLSRNYLAHW